jgi:hypothetical protein
LRELREGINESYGRYKAIVGGLQGLPTQAVAVLGVPAVVCWIFSALLLATDMFNHPCILMKEAEWALMLAGAGLVYLVAVARRMLGDAELQGRARGAPGQPGAEVACP